jgi:hypothetical protein
VTAAARGSCRARYYQVFYEVAPAIDLTFIGCRCAYSAIAAIFDISGVPFPWLRDRNRLSSNSVMGEMEVQKPMTSIVVCAPQDRANDNQDENP